MTLLFSYVTVWPCFFLYLFTFVRLIYNLMMMMIIVKYTSPQAAAEHGLISMREERGAWGAAPQIFWLCPLTGNCFAGGGGNMQIPFISLLQHRAARFEAICICYSFWNNQFWCWQQGWVAEHLLKNFGQRCNFDQTKLRLICSFFVFYYSASRCIFNKIIKILCAI